MGQPGWKGNGPQVLPPPKTVIWDAGQVVGQGRLVAVVFEADSQEGRRLVTGYAPADWAILHHAGPYAVRRSAALTDMDRRTRVDFTGTPAS